MKVKQLSLYWRSFTVCKGYFTCNQRDNFRFPYNISDSTALLVEKDVAYFIGIYCVPYSWVLTIVIDLHNLGGIHSEKHIIRCIIKKWSKWEGSLIYVFKMKQHSQRKLSKSFDYIFDIFSFIFSFNLIKVVISQVGFPVNCL